MKKEKTSLAMIAKWIREEKPSADNVIQALTANGYNPKVDMTLSSTTIRAFSGWANWQHIYVNYIGDEVNYLYLSS